MQNNKSTIIKDSLILLVITLVAGALLGLVYEVTKGPIAAQKMAEKLKAYQAIYADANTLEEDTELMEVASNISLSDYDSNYANIKVEEVNKAFDASGNQIGYIIVVTTGEGFGGDISMAIGYTLEGKTTGMEVLTISETAGLGSKAADAEFKDQFIDRMATQFTYVKDNGAAAEDEINAISGATITTKAVTNAINGGLYFLNHASAELGGTGLE